jgi:glycosyltransferase involved in cell wall biosynthesis
LRGTHWTERRVLRSTPDLVICNSHYTADAVAAWLPSAPLEVVYAPVSASPAERGTRDEIRRELGADEATTVIVIASRFERWKGHAELLEAASRLQGKWTIWIAGGAQRPVEQAYARELDEFARSAGIADRVRFLGERRDVPRLLQGADIHCQPNSAPEPFGVAFIEALYAGLPVVTSDAGGAREIVTSACGMLVPIGDRAALVAALQSLIDDPARRKALGAAGPARARALSDPAAQIAALERVLAPRRAEVVA